MANVVPLVIVALGAAVCGFIEARGGFQNGDPANTLTAWTLVVLWVAWGARIFLSERRRKKGRE